MPFVVASERRTLFAFYLADSEITDGLEVQTAEFVDCVSVAFGYPNDEVLHGHRLFDRGLEFYALHVVEDSTWIDELRRMERAHDRSPAQPFANSKHFLLAFHDATLEAVASDVVALDRYTTMDEAVAAVVSLAFGRG